jgi:hypothetical protein
MEDWEMSMFLMPFSQSDKPIHAPKDISFNIDATVK